MRRLHEFRGGARRMRHDPLRRDRAQARAASLDFRRSGAAGAGRLHVAIVAAELPAHHPAGHNLVLRDYIRFFRSRGYRISLILTTARMGGVMRRRRRLGCELYGPGILRIGGTYVACSAAAILANLAWRAFFLLPAGAQSASARCRDMIRRWRGIDHVLGRFLDAKAEDFVRRRLALTAPDAVFYNSIFSCVEDPRGAVPGARHYVITHDVMFERARSFRRLGYSVAPDSLDAPTEQARLEKAGNIIAIQPEDAEAFRALAPSANVLTVLASMVAPCRPPGRVAHPRKCLFVASGSFHNVDGIAWFLRDCWPTIVQALPDARLQIVGSICARLSAVPPGVDLEGIVDDIDAAYRDAALCVVPLRAGSGLKIKLVEAIAHGVPAVTTSVGAQGLAFLRPAPFRVADDAADFAHAVIDLLSTETQRHQLEAAAGQAARRFLPQAAFAELAFDLEKSFGARAAKS